MRPLVRLASVFLLSAAAASAQVHETIHVNLIEVPVTVVDRNGDPVRGLKAENFELIDQGHKQTITSFDVMDFASPEINRASPLNPSARRTFLLLFDLTFSSPLGRSKAEDAALNFIARSLHRSDLAAVGTIDVDRGFRLLTAFTTDRNLLTAAIKSPVTFRSSDPLQIAGKVGADVVLPQQATVQPDSNQTNDKAAIDTDIAQEIQRGQNRLNDQYNRSRIERQVTLLGGLARSLRMLPGRKQVVFFSEGFDPRLVRGRDVMASGEAIEEQQQEENGEVWKIDTDNRYGDTRSMSVVQQMARMFRGSDVVLDAVDIQGVRVQNDIQNGATINSNDGLFLLAKPTGGVVFRNSNDLKSDLERMLHQQEVVYVLGFQAPSDHPGRFHDLKVKVQGVSGAQVFHRAGYYEAGGENALEKLLSTAQIILNDLPQSDIRVAALAAPFPTSGQNAQVPVILEINGADLLKDAKANAVTADIYIYAFDDDGLVRDRMFQRMRLDVPKIGAKIRESGIKFYATLSLPPGRYAVKSLVRVLETERKGYVRTDVVVPGANDVAVLPPFFVEDPGKWVMIKGGSHDSTNAPYPFHINGEPFIPSAGVEVHNGQPRQFAVFVYNAAPDEMAWQTSVSDAGGPHAAAPRLLKEMKGDDVTKMMFQFAPADLGTGDARLDFSVHKKGSADVRTGSVAMKVER